MQQNNHIAFALSLLAAVGIVSCSDSDPGGTEPEVVIVPPTERGAGDITGKAPVPRIPDPDETAAAPAADSTPPARNMAPPHEEDPTFTGTWEGFWDGQWRVLFEFGQQRENGEMEVVYRWEELPGRPMNERRYIGYFSHGDVHLEPQRDTRRKKKITLVKVYPSDGETAIFAVGKFGKSRMTMLSPVPATAQQE